jgi:hypothetical protein
MGFSSGSGTSIEEGVYHMSGSVADFINAQREDEERSDEDIIEATVSEFDKEGFIVQQSEKVYIGGCQHSFDLFIFQKEAVEA